MRRALAAGNSAAPVENLAKEKQKKTDGKGKARETPSQNEDQPSSAASEEEPAHIVMFNQSDVRKRGRSYLGISYGEFFLFFLRTFFADIVLRPR